MTNVQVKIFNGRITKIDKEVNEFLTGKVISDIKLIADIDSADFVTVMVIYCEWNLLGGVKK